MSGESSGNTNLGEPGQKLKDSFRQTILGLAGLDEVPGVELILEETDTGVAFADTATASNGDRLTLTTIYSVSPDDDLLKVAELEVVSEAGESAAVAITSQYDFDAIFARANSDQPGLETPAGETQSLEQALLGLDGREVWERLLAQSGQAHQESQAGLWQVDAIELQDVIDRVRAAYGQGDASV